MKPCSSEHLYLAKTTAVEKVGHLDTVTRTKYSTHNNNP